MFHDHEHVKDSKSGFRYDAEVTGDEGYRQVRTTTLADTSGSCAAKRAGPVSAATRLQFVARPASQSRVLRFSNEIDQNTAFTGVSRWPPFGGSQNDPIKPLLNL
jgi:hypothetical protein